MKLLKTDRLENPMLIVLAGEERSGKKRRGKEGSIICQQKKKYKVSVSSVSRHPVTHFTFWVLSTLLCLPGSEKNISLNRWENLQGKERHNGMKKKKKEPTGAETALLEPRRTRI